jgi:hypothetical protein
MRLNTYPLVALMVVLFTILAACAPSTTSNNSTSETDTSSSQIGRPFPLDAQIILPLTMEKIDNKYCQEDIEILLDGELPSQNDPNKGEFCYRFIGNLDNAMKTMSLSLTRANYKVNSSSISSGGSGVELWLKGDEILIRAIYSPITLTKETFIAISYLCITSECLKS